ncbi:hypothetical protein KP509_29G051500 [Ceratopteris richardii]|nr:hypothetical protein KP509_29G051500 [Ceratopteris richardii]
MYSRCGMLTKAYQTLQDLYIQDIMAWSALIGSYVERGQAHDALHCYNKMQLEGLRPNSVSIILALKACGMAKMLLQGIQIHNDISRFGILKEHTMLGNALINMYAKCGALSKARKILEELRTRNVVSWSSLIAGHAQQKQCRDAFNCFKQMEEEGIAPNDVTFICLLKACASIGAADKGQKIHNEIARHALLGKCTALDNALVDMYAKCGDIKKAERVFEEIPTRDVASWSALISGYTQCGQGENALNCFERMLCEGITPNNVAFLCVLKACGSIGALNKGEQIHDEIIRQKLLGKDPLLGNALVDMYVKCGAFATAHEVLYGLHERDVISWSTLILGHLQQGHDEEALICFKSMQREGFSPDTVTLVLALKACGNIGSIEIGKEIHEEVARRGLLKHDISLGNALVDMYAKCGRLIKARQVLEELPIRDVITWSALISGYADKGHGENALDCFEQMQSEGISPNAVSYLSVLKACGSIGATDRGGKIHEEIRTKGLLRDNVKLGNALVCMYTKCGAITEARKVIEEFSIQDATSWNALIIGYVQKGQGENAVLLFEMMLCKGITPDGKTFACILKACGAMGQYNKGKQIHDEIARRGLLVKDVVLSNVLVDMYAKCGALTKAQEVFDKLPTADVIAWSSLVATYGQEGQFKNALECFEQMLLNGIMPDRVAFSCVLNACSHSGLVDEGQIYFTQMMPDFGITPDSEHFTCMVDLLGRAGQLLRAMSLTRKMPSCDYAAVWSALMGACQKWGDAGIGKWAFDNAICMDKEDAATYVSMFNIYMAAGMHEEAYRIKTILVDNLA